MKARHAGLCLGALLLASAAAAQQAPSLHLAGEGGGGAILPPATTRITADTDPTRALGTIVTPAGAVQLIDGGTRAGSNLFHSFAQFDLARGDTARFVYSAGDPAAIANVVSRVTGGAPSHIEGTIDSTALPNADFWFINPAGIVFGEGASLNVPAAAHFATAQELRFASGPAFAMTTPGGSTLSVAAPQAFGFLGGQGSIEVRNAAPDFLGGAGRLTLAGRDIEISDSEIAGAALHLIGVGAAAAEIRGGDPLTSAGTTGAVLIQRATLSASNPVPGGSAEILVAGGDVTIDEGSSLSTESPPGSAGDPGRIAIRAATVRLRQGSTISSTASDRPSGDIEIHAGRLEITSSSARENPLGPTGISSDSRGAGNAGAILLDVDALVMDGPVFVTSDGFSLGNGGRIGIDADTIDMTNGALIASQTFGLGVGGEISIHARSLLVGFEALIQSDTGAPGGFPDFEAGDGGSILLDVGSLVIRDTGQVRASTFTFGNAGSISVRADSVRLENSGLISSESFSGGNAGRVDIAARSLDIDGGEISTTAYGGCVGEGCRAGGNAGDISIDAAAITLRGQGGLSGSINSDTFTQGNAGSIAIRADTVQLAIDSRIASSAQFNSSGDAGSIEIAARTLAMEFAAISSSALGSGSAGRIAVNADILIDRRSSITSTAGLDARGAGTISLTGGRIRVDHDSLISSSTFGNGPGGGVDIVAGRLEVAEFSQILSSTFGSGDGGQVKIAADAVDLDMGADIASRAEEGSSGNAGTVRIDAGSFAARRAGGLSSSTIGEGDAGTVIVNADSLLLDEDSHISSGSSPNATGGSGSVLISAGTLDVFGGSSVETSSNNARPAGSVAIVADAIRVDGAGSSISSANQFAGAGDAGTVSIEAAALNVANGGEISTSSAAGAAGDIVIAMPQDGLLRLDGAVAPGVITTSSGPGTGGRIIIAAPRAIISNGGSILALGERGGANVQIQTMFFISSADRTNLVAVDGSFLLEAQVGDVSRGTVERDLSVIDASSVLRGQCAAVRETGRVSQLVVRPVGPYARPALSDPLRPAGPQARLALPNSLRPDSCA